MSARDVLLLLGCALLVAWVRLLPLDASRMDADHTYVGADGYAHVYPGDYDGYLWLRHARTLLATGDPCDAVVDGACRDEHTTAPVGARSPYARSLHVHAVAALHRLVTTWAPQQPLPDTATLLPVVVGVAGVLPAFAIGRMLAGPVAGVFAGVMTMLDPLVLGRSIGGDNDVWNVVLPLYTLWLVLLALRARGTGARVAWAIAAGACTGLHAWAWSGWMFTHVVLAAGLVALVPLEGRRAAVVLGVFVAASAIASILTPEGGYLRLPRAMIDAVVPHAPPAAELAWPSALRIVDELRRLDPSALLRLAGGPLVLAGAILGVVLSLSPGGVVRAGGVLLAVWLAAGVWMASGGVRYHLLFVPPLAVACAIAIGRATTRVRREIRSAGRGYRVVATTVLGGVLALALLRALAPGWSLASSHRPRMNDAWWDALTQLRDTTSPDAIVHGWWDFGHWTTYVAERRAANDGSALETHVPYWTARALLAADETESAGILRMLSCASDALPRPEGARGAYATVRRSGREPAAAFAIVSALVERDAAAADDHLRAEGFGTAERAEILRATHCTPADSYLVLSTRLLDTRTALVDLGARDPRRGPIPQRAFDASDPGTPFLARWVPCEPVRDGERVCPIDASIAGGTIRLASVSWPETAPDRAVLASGRAGGTATTGTPALVLVAGASGLARYTPPDPAHPDLGVLIDVPNTRVLVGAPAFLGSTLVQLLHLDGRCASRFAKVDERSAAGERVTTWKLRWP
ncbi:MAG: hypothetical protein KIT14_06950 [bacterium]|nr:hypothetical protein [bacterium]